MAWLQLDGRDPLQLMPGDLLLLPSGAAHRLSSEPGGRCRPFDRAMKEERMTPAGDLELGAGAGAATAFVCAAYGYDLEVGRALLSLLPEVLHVPADPVAGRHAAALVQLLADRAARSGDRPRARSDACAPRASVDSRQLAAEVHLSRATLARRFRAAVGEPPLAYLAGWRMQLAVQRLKHSTDAVEAIAQAVGYTSEYAFSRAFARHRAEPPGRYRRRVRAADAPSTL